MTRQSLRHLWWQIHKWTGLALMILFIPLGLSGVVLTWDDAIDHRLNPQRYAAQGPAALPPSAYAGAARAGLRPDERLSQLALPKGEGPVVATAVRVPPPGARRAGRPERITLWLDPRDAHVLDMSRGDAGLIRLAHVFHGSLFLAMPAGRALVGVLGVAMALMAVGGLWLWWPPVGRWTKGLRWRRGDRRLDTNLHHMAGFWIALPLAAQAVTGVWIAAPQMAAAVGLGAPRPGGGPGRGTPVATVRMTPEQAVAAAGAGDAARIGWPGSDDGQWRISARRGDMLVDDATGAAQPAPARDGGVMSVMRRYHDGSLIGSAWRVLLIVIGLAPTLFGVTGLLMWWRGRRWRKAARLRARKREAASA